MSAHKMNREWKKSTREVRGSFLLLFLYRFHSLFFNLKTANNELILLAEVDILWRTKNNFKVVKGTCINLYWDTTMKRGGGAQIFYLLLEGRIGVISNVKIM